MRAFFDARPDLAPTPARPLPSLARKLGLAALFAKDESSRFGLNAFKLLGARFAIETLRAEGQLRPGAKVVCASEGNHGRAVARAAREAGCAARVYMAHDAAQARADAIAGEGAEVIRVDGSYDEAVRILQTDAAQHGWTIVSDTAWPGYERIPFLIMLGYTRMMDEIRDQGSGIGDQGFHAVFVQGGVGGLLCAVASWCAFHWPACKVIGVEPTDAACLQASARAGRPIAVTGSLKTTMAGLRNREVSPPAFASLLPNVDAFMAIDDVWAHDAMRVLAHPIESDAGISAGASGSAALGGLLALCRDTSMHDVKQQLGLGPASRVLVIVSEGVTDPDLWSAVTAQR
ncbi:MAG TPA: diaminopropionate ammonia-lyase [Vicinamibacterales bacterium]|nr:diaminopropionate ammonia-lyase [Vicinamibacterales bacterium]